MAGNLSASESRDVLELLGGKKTLGHPLRTPADYVDLVRRGLPYGAFRSVAAQLTLSFQDVQDTLQLSPRTLHRRKAQRLSQVESERVMRLARVAARARHVLGDLGAALDWLSSPNRALAGERPLRLLDTDLGAEQVQELLGRIEHAVYS
jgi:putative toxin-antitoxin system antitoxin component (TIGR02293 family)